MSTLLLPWQQQPVLLLLALTLVLSACSTRQGPTSDTLAQSQWEAPVYIDRDDGLPLTAIESAALNSTGELDKNLDLNALHDVAVQFKYFLHSGRTTMMRFSQRSQAYLGYTRQVFRQRGLPEELAYLAIVESGYNVRAVSPVGASGAWQFMPYTGMKYGLNQDWWMDERLDPYKAAEAAASYLAKLYRDFGDWHLAIAAYNAGEGKIGRALDGTGAKGFFALKQLNYKLDEKAQIKPETQQYVPRFLAVCKIMRNLEALGFAPVDINRQPAVVRVDATPGTDLKALAAAISMPWEEFTLHNAAHKQYVSHVDRMTYVYVPAEKQGAARLQMTAARSGDSWKQYTAGKKDSWESISRKSKVPVAVLRAANRGVALKSGRNVRVPSGPNCVTPAPYVEERAVAQNTRATSKDKGREKGNKTKGQETYYVVQSGDSLGKIAQRYDVPMATLMQLNNISDPQHVRIGQRLRIDGKSSAVERPTERALAQAAPAAKNAPAAKAAPAVAVHKEKTRAASGSDGAIGQPRSGAGSAKKATYTVQAGDTLWAIARKHNVSPARLLEMNNREKADHIRVGEKLLVSEQ